MTQNERLSSNNAIPFEGYIAICNQSRFKPSANVQHTDLKIPLFGRGGISEDLKSILIRPQCIIFSLLRRARNNSRPNTSASTKLKLLCRRNMHFVNTPFAKARRFCTKALQIRFIDQVHNLNSLHYLHCTVYCCTVAGSFVMGMPQHFTFSVGGHPPVKYSEEEKSPKTNIKEEKIKKNLKTHQSYFFCPCPLPYFQAFVTTDHLHYYTIFERDKRLIHSNRIFFSDQVNKFTYCNSVAL